jgi:hypothetical protein
MRKVAVVNERAGWDIPSWCGACDISRAKFYTLSPQMRPRTLKLGKRHIVIESPAEYLGRLAAAQEAG